MSFQPTAGQLAKIRNPFQSTDLFLSLYEPKIVFAAQIDANELPNGSRNLPFTNVITGSYLNTEPGMTVIIGTTAYNDNLGRVRLISGSGADLLVAMDKTLQYPSGTWIAVKDFHEIWAVQPNSVLIDTESKSTIMYKDYDISYSDQNTNFDPVINVGSHYAGFYSGTNSMTYFDGSNSFLELGTINTMLWYFPTGSSQFIVTGTTPGWINLPTTPGHYTVKIKAIGSNGKTKTAYRHYSLYNKTTNQPITDWFLTDLSGDYQNGWNAKISVGNGADRFKDGYLCVIFMDQWYGGEQISFGPVYGQERTLFVGYVNLAETTYNAMTNRTIISLKGTTSYLKNKEMYSVSLEFATSPDNWTQLYDTSINRIINHYLRWHTTLLDVCDYYRNNTGHGLITDQFEDIAKNELISGINGVTHRIFCNYNSDRLGRTFIDVDYNMVITGSRPASFMAWQDTDWLASPQFNEIIDKPTSFVQLGGVAFDKTNTLTGTAYLSRAPGENPGIGYTGRSETVDGYALVITGSQDYVNQMSGLFLAKRNNRYVNQGLETVGYFPNVDVTPSAFYDLYLESGTTHRHTIFNPIRLLPRAMKITYKNNALQQEIQWESETYGHAGETYIMPVDPVTTQTGGGGDSGIIPIVEPSGDNGGRQTWVTTPTKIGYTENLTAGSPTWINKTGGVSGVIVDFVLDPFDPTNVVLALTTTGIWKSNNAANITPTWKKIFNISGSSANQFNSSLNPRFLRLCTTIARRGRYYALATATNGSDSGLYCYTTSDGGTTWYRYFIANTQVVGYFSFGSFPGASVIASTATNPNNILTLSSNCVDYANVAESQYIEIDLGGVYAISRVNAKVTTTGLFGDWTVFKYKLNLGDSWTNAFPGDLTSFASLSCSVFPVGYPNGAGFTEASARYVRIEGQPYALGNNRKFYEAGVYIGSGAVPAGIKQAFDCGDHNPDIVYTSDGTAILRSVNGGVTWSTYIADGANDLECPYAGNPTDNNIVYWGTDGELHLTNGSNAGSALLTEANPDGTKFRRSVTFVQSTGATIAVVEATASTSKTVKITTNSGASWVSGPSGIAGATQIGYWPYSETRVFLLSDTQILYSNDGGMTFGNKNGNWASVMGESYASGNMIVPNWTRVE